LKPLAQCETTGNGQPPGSVFVFRTSREISATTLGAVLGSSVPSDAAACQAIATPTDTRTHRLMHKTSVILFSPFFAKSEASIQSSIHDTWSRTKQ